jgi:hypothetical protein
MKARKLLLAMFVCQFAVAMYAAENANMGTWKLDEAKSKIQPGAPMSSTVVYSSEGDNIKVTTDGVNANKQPMHTEWTGKFDGKDYPVTGAQDGTTRSYTEVNDRTLHLTTKVNGKETGHGKIEVSKDGKTRTVELQDIAADGKKAKSKGVYDKQ